MRQAFGREACSIVNRLRELVRALLCGLALTVGGCGSGGEGDAPAQLTIGVLPDEAEEDLRRRYAPLVAHLRQALDTEILLVVPRDYGEILDLFGAGKLDLAMFGGVTFIAASERHGAEPLVVRDIDLQFTSYFLSRIEEPAATIEGFRGRSFAFGSELSTSGHFMPRHFMQARGLTPEETFASVEYSGAHDQTVYWVRDGRVDLGAVNGQLVRAMLIDGRLAPGEVRVVEETPPYADYVWAVQANLNQDFVNRLRNVFLALSPEDENDAAILSNLGAGGFLPARDTDFADLRAAVSALQSSVSNDPRKSQ